LIELTNKKTQNITNLKQQAEVIVNNYSTNQSTENNFMVERILVKYMEYLSNKDVTYGKISGKRSRKYSSNVILFLWAQLIKKNPITTEQIKSAEIEFFKNIPRISNKVSPQWIDFQIKSIKLKQYWKGLHTLEKLGIVRLEREGRYYKIFFTVS
jgi:hypothetical protein